MWRLSLRLEMSRAVGAQPPSPEKILDGDPRDAYPATVGAGSFR